MKVKELIEILNGEDPELEVHVAYRYGDYWHTTVAPRIQDVETGMTRYSEYHRMPKISDEDDLDDPADPECRDKPALLLLTTRR